MSKTPAGSDTDTQASPQVAPQNSAEHSQHVSLHNRDGRGKSVQNEKREYPNAVTQVLAPGLVILICFLFFLDLAVVSTATTAITSQFYSLIDVGWYKFERKLSNSYLTGPHIPLSQKQTS